MIGSVVASLGVGLAFTLIFEKLTIRPRARVLLFVLAAGLFLAGAALTLYLPTPALKDPQ